VKFRKSRELEGKMKSATISRNGSIGMCPFCVNWMCQSLSIHRLVELA